MAQLENRTLGTIQPLLVIGNRNCGRAANDHSICTNHANIFDSATFPITARNVLKSWKRLCWTNTLQIDRRLGTSPKKDANEDTKNDFLKKGNHTIVAQSIPLVTYLLPPTTLLNFLTVPLQYVELNAVAMVSTVRSYLRRFRNDLRYKT